MESKPILIAAGVAGGALLLWRALTGQPVPPLPPSLDPIISAKITSCKVVRQ